MFWAETFRRLEALTSGNIERLLLTIGVLILLVGVRMLARRARQRDEIDSRGRLLLSTSVATTTAISVIAILGIWGLGWYLLASLETLDLADHVTSIVLAVVVLGSAYVLSDFLGQVIRELVRDQAAIDKHQEEVMRRTMQVSVYVLALLLVVGLFTDNVGSLLVGAGFLGIVVGMAARQTLGAVLAGFVLMFSRPFEVGDWVKIGEFEGTVSDITIINTRLRSFDGEYVTIPNDEVRSSAVVDRSWRDRLRVEVEVGIDYDSDPDEAARVALEAIEGIEEVLTVPEPAVVAKRFGDSAVILGIRFWIGNPSSRKRWRTQTTVMNGVKAAFESEGIEIPFPQRVHSDRDGDGGFEVSLDEAGGGTVLNEGEGQSRTSPEDGSEHVDSDTADSR